MARDAAGGVGVEEVRGPPGTLSHDESSVWIYTGGTDEGHHKAREQGYRHNLGCGSAGGLDERRRMSAWLEAREALIVDV